MQTVRVVAKTHAGMKDSPTYVMARRVRFPRSDDVLAARGAWLQRENTEVAVCPECCAERDNFIRAQYPRWLLTHELAS
jgi:hypothetical protein